MSINNITTAAVPAANLAPGTGTVAFPAATAYAPAIVPNPTLKDISCVSLLEIIPNEKDTPSSKLISEP
jgi:hypothetical protein